MPTFCGLAYQCGTLARNSTWSSLGSVSTWNGHLVPRMRVRLTIISASRTANLGGNPISPHQTRRFCIGHIHCVPWVVCYPFRIVVLCLVLSCNSHFYHAQPSIALAFPSTSVPYPMSHSPLPAYHLMSLSSIRPVSSSKCMVFAKDRDVFCPTAICSCVSVFLSQDCSWGLLCFIEDDAAEKACLG